ncbi:MAG TPA: tetratricopeptide repeat protein, partial [Nitrospiraceae bacterium]|nr:tetratricopeptide repeat protein [Nitrospiraceae bacterium]
QKWAEAIEAYREVSDREGRVSGDPWPAAARRRLSAILEPWLMAALKAGDEWTAMMLFHRHGTMADHAYSGKDLIVRVADAHRRAGFSAEAVKMYQTILKNPSARAIHEEALIGLGASYLDQTDFVSARKIFERYRVQYPLGRHKLDALGLLAMTLHGQGLLPEAIRLCRQWLDLSPNHADRPRMWARLGAALIDHGETALALKAYADADREGALLSPSARLRYADLLARHRAPEEALRQYQAALRLSPGEPEVQWAAIGLAGLGQDSKRAADTDAMFRDIGRMTDDPWTTRVVSALRADLSTDAGQEPD